MAFDYINEAFKRLNILDEEMFNTSLDGINKLDNFMQQDIDADTVVSVIDPSATTEEELENSYVGKVITNCNVCHSHIFNNKDEIVIDPEDGSVNLETACPYCGESEGFTIVGEIAPYAPAETTPEEPAQEDETVIEDSVETSTEIDTVPEEDTDVVEESLNSEDMSRASRRCIQEDFKEVSITTEDQHLEMTSDENGKVTVTTEPVENETLTTEETIVPVSDETEAEILQANDVEDTVEEDEFDYDFDEVDEEGFDELGEGYLKNVYENVDRFKTTDVYTSGNNLIVEGMITFNSGLQKKTGFMFEAKDANARGQLRFVGTNKHLCESLDAFSLVGRVDNKKLFVESLKYNYSVNENVVRGRIRRK